MKDIKLEFRDVWKIYTEKTEALKNINLSLKKNSLNLIIGPSGSGKSTLLNIASLLDVPTKGKIRVAGKNTQDLTKSDKSKLRMKEIGVIYQRQNLFPYLNILENTMLPMISADKGRALKLMRDMDLIQTSKYPDEISMEDKQKVALARAMVNHPSIILADEPTGELDENGTEVLMDLIANAAHKYTVLMVSNNFDLAHYADNLFYIKNGKIKKEK